jgi:hypothetical protein
MFTTPSLLLNIPCPLTPLGAASRRWPHGQLLFPQTMPEIVLLSFLFISFYVDP